MFDHSSRAAVSDRARDGDAAPAAAAELQVRLDDRDPGPRRVRPRQAALAPRALPARARARPRRPAARARAALPGLLAADGSFVCLL